MWCNGGTLAAFYIAASLSHSKYHHRGNILFMLERFLLRTLKDYHWMKEIYETRRRKKIHQRKENDNLVELSGYQCTVPVCLASGSALLSSL